MNRIVRLLGFVLVLLLLFLGAVALSSRWSKTHFERLRAESIEAKRSQLDALVRYSRAGSLPWSLEQTTAFAAILDARIGPDTDDSQSDAGGKGDKQWSFHYPQEDATASASSRVRVSFEPPAAARFSLLFQQLTVALLVAALALFILFCAALFLARQRRFESAATEAPIQRAEMGSLTHLAKTSVAQSLALDRERSERLRAEEDLHFQQILLNRSLEEKIRLGHDLHDGIIQSLYATGLMLEAAKNNVEKDPGEAKRQLDATLTGLNTTIRDVRSYILGLVPENLRQQSFAQAVESLTKTLDAGRKTDFDVRIDDTVATRLRDNEMTDLLQITHEAVSNGLRHGAASRITIRLHQDAGALCLLVQDNGKGFDPARVSQTGHGLGNMKARAERLRAKLQLESSPSTGTRLVLTLPAPLPAA